MARMIEIKGGKRVCCLGDKENCLYDIVRDELGSECADLLDEILTEVRAENNVGSDDYEVVADGLRSLLYEVVDDLNRTQAMSTYQLRPVIQLIIHKILEGLK